jgi:hypothetical protein
MKALKFHVRGLVPTLMHNGQLADPLNKWAVELKKVTAKRKKTEDDIIEMARIEHAAGLYLDADDANPQWPSMNIMSMVCAGARKSKEGRIAQSGIIVVGHAPLLYKGPKTIDGLWSDPKFVNRAKVKVGQASVMRTRPIFPDWELEFTIEYSPDLVQRDRLEEWVEVAGRQIGLSDWRPVYGRFEVVSVEEVE